MPNRKKAARLPTDQAKEKFLSLMEEYGLKVEDAVMKVGYSRKAYDYWRKHDQQFAEKADLIRAVRTGNKKMPAKERMRFGFADFRRKYLGMETFPHQQQWIDVIEGREPEFLHASVTYEPGNPNFVLINTAPEHSKTISISCDYVTYRICQDPNVRILLVSKTQERAKEFVYAVKQRLTHPRYADLQIAFAPEDGFKGGSAVWSSTTVYLGDSVRDSSEKDPTLVACGIGGQIYGARADLIIIDDGITLSNANAYEAHLRWIQQEVITRLGPTGQLIVAGTRVDPIDLYSELRNGERYPDGRSPWTYLAQPAVLEFADDPKDWKTLWPKSNIPWPGSNDLPDKDGLYPRWNGVHLSRRRSQIDPKTWSMVYMQQSVSDDSLFQPKDLRACVNGNRTAGVLQKANEYHREEGMDGLFVICSMDPAMAGETASIAYAVDVKTRNRYVLEAHRMAAPSPAQIRDLIRVWSEKYSPNCWVIEKNAFQLFLTRDEEIRSYLANRGIAMLEHFSGNNKLDPDFGVASLAPLFTERMIELPSSHNCEGVKALIEQLITWRAGVKTKLLKQDLPMALWFAEIKAREICDSTSMRHNMHRSNKYLPRYRRGQAVTINLDDYMRDPAAA